MSVVVPVFDDPAGLQLCLAGLAVQTYPRDQFEVLVVDNGSSRSLAPLLAGCVNARLLVEPGPGSYRARNRGIRAARGELLAFTDADCRPRPDWLEQGVRALLAEPGLGLVAGQVDVVARDPDRPTVLELFAMANQRRQWDYVALDRFSETSNLFTRRTVLDRVGSFDERLLSCGDLVWGRRVAAAGWGLRYAATARVEHPALGAIRALARRYGRLVGGKYQIRRLYGPEVAATCTSPIDRGQLVASLRRSWRDGRLPGVPQRLGVSAILVLLQVVAVVERLRVRLGGRPRR